MQEHNRPKASRTTSRRAATAVADLTAGGALLARLRALGVEYVFANAGTDFPPLIESLAEAGANGTAMPQALVIPHEHAAMGMAHGYYLATGRPQAVIAHTNVGLSNCVIGAINAAFEHVPVLMFSGRTPVTEQGRFGSRAIPIGWGQEMRDQTAMLRELVKWDYELRFPEQVPELIDRAMAIAQSSQVAAVMFGGADFAGELGVALAWEPLLAARGALILACAEARVAAIDVPFVALDDKEGLADECRRAKALGFSAKAAIHPAQVATIEATFAPSAADVREAEEALAAYRDGGERAIRFKGRMLEAPLVKRYRAILEKQGNSDQT